MQKEITELSPLLGEDGRLAVKGFSRKPLFKYERGAVAAKKIRIKEWDYYLVRNGDCAVALTVADNYYMGLVSASLIELRGSRPWEQTTNVIVPLTVGKVNMPESSESGDVRFKNRRCEFAFTHEAGGKRRLFCRLDRFKDNKPFNCDITLFDEPEESVFLAAPFRGNDKAFYHTRKLGGMLAEGFAEFDGARYEFKPDSSFGTLDWGRSVWTYKNSWYWSGANGYVDGHRVGFNVSYGFADDSAATENAILYDGRLHKLEDVSVIIPTKDGKPDYMSPWTFTSPDGRLECSFVPTLDRAAYLGAVVIETDQHQVFGKFYGRLTLDDGRIIEIEGLDGFAERVRNKW